MTASLPFSLRGIWLWGTQQAQEEYCYPGSLYEGIELFLDLDALSRQPYPLFQESEVSPEEIMEHLHTHRRLYLASTPPAVQAALDELWQLRDSQELGLIKLLSARLLWEVKAPACGGQSVDPLLHPLPGGHCQGNPGDPVRRSEPEPHGAGVGRAVSSEAKPV